MQIFSTWTCPSMWVPAVNRILGRGDMRWHLINAYQALSSPGMDFSKWFLVSFLRIDLLGRSGVPRDQCTHGTKGFDIMMVPSCKVTLSLSLSFVILYINIWFGWIVNTLFLARWALISFLRVLWCSSFMHIGFAQRVWATRKHMCII